MEKIALLFVVFIIAVFSVGYLYYHMRDSRKQFEEFVSIQPKNKVLISKELLNRVQNSYEIVIDTLEILVNGLSKKAQMPLLRKRLSNELKELNDVFNS